MSHLTMSVEMDSWLESHTTPPTPPLFARPAAPKAVPSVPITDAEFAWLWPRFQKCRFGSISAATSFARTELSRVTPRGKLFCLRMTHRHRTQIFGKRARAMSEDEILGLIREAAARPQNL